jgi:hypothetical protein
MVRDALFNIAQDAGLLLQKEVLNILDFTNEKPADILIPDYQNGKNC